MKSTTNFILIHILLLVFDDVALSVVKSSRFVQEEMCDLEESFKRGCSKEVGRARSKMECIILCGRETDCVGASLDTQGMCLHHHLCHNAVPCPGEQGTPNSSFSTHHFMAPYCLHGTWDSATKTCDCHHRTFGKRCNEYHTFCGNLSGNVNDEIPVILDPLEDGKHLIKVICRPQGYAMVFKNSGSPAFNKTWFHYVNGFMIDENNYWAGLEPWYIILTSGLNHLTISIEFRSAFMHAYYKDFAMSGKEHGYNFTGTFDKTRRFHAPPAGHTMDHCLSALQGVAFSTWDRDPARGSSRGENCASLAGSGWWFNGTCDNPTHLLGWGLDNYAVTPPAQRLTISGVDVAQVKEDIVSVYGFLEKK